MRSLFRSVALLATLTALPAVAAAQDRGAYAGLALGTGARLDGDYAQSFESDGHASARIHGGYRFGPWGVEASYFGTGMTRKSDNIDYSLSAIGLAGKYHLTFGYGLEWYVRLGLNQSTMHAGSRPDGSPRVLDGINGMGIDYGTGVTWQSNPLGTARIKPRVGGFVDLGIHRVTVSGNDREFGGSMGTIQVGFLSSIDF